MMAAAGRFSRFVVLIAGALVLQVSVASQLTVFGYVLDLLLLVAVCAGVNGGSDRGASSRAACHRLCAVPRRQRARRGVRSEHSARASSE